MNNANLSQSIINKKSQKIKGEAKSRRRRQYLKKTPGNSDVLVSAVISTYLLTHLHHVLQRAEVLAVKEGRTTKATNYAQLRKVLCMDARSMEDAWAAGTSEGELDQVA